MTAASNGKKRLLCFLLLCCSLLCAAAPSGIYAAGEGGSGSGRPGAENYGPSARNIESLIGVHGGFFGRKVKIADLQFKFDEVEAYDYSLYTLVLEFQYIAQNAVTLEYYSGDVSPYCVEMDADKLKSGLIDGIKDFFGFADKRFTLKFDWNDLISQCSLYGQGYDVTVASVDIYFCRKDNPEVTGPVVSVKYTWSDPVSSGNCVGIRYTLVNPSDGKVWDESEESGVTFSSILALVSSVIVDLPMALVSLMSGAAAVIGFLPSFLSGLFPFLPSYVFGFFIAVLVFLLFLFFYRLVKS